MSRNCFCVRKPPDSMLRGMGEYDFFLGPLESCSPHLRPLYKRFGLYNHNSAGVFRPGAGFPSVHCTWLLCSYVSRRTFLMVSSLLCIIKESVRLV